MRSWRIPNRNQRYSHQFQCDKYNDFKLKRKKLTAIELFNFHKKYLNWTHSDGKKSVSEVINDVVDFCWAKAKLLFAIALTMTDCFSKLIWSIKWISIVMLKCRSFFSDTHLLIKMIGISKCAWCGWEIPTWISMMHMKEISIDKMHSIVILFRHFIVFFMSATKEIWYRYLHMG